MRCFYFFFFKQKTAYEMRISDWSSDVCSSDLTETIPPPIVLITIGSVTGVSIAALFEGGIVPAVVLGAALCSVVWWRHRKEDLSRVRRTDKKEIGRASCRERVCQYV